MAETIDNQMNVYMKRYSNDFFLQKSLEDVPIDTFSSDFPYTDIMSLLNYIRKSGGIKATAEKI